MFPVPAPLGNAPSPVVDSKFHLEADSTGFSVNEIQSGREVWHSAAFFRSKEIIRQLESGQNVDVDIVGTTRFLALRSAFCPSCHLALFSSSSPRIT